MAHRSLTSSLFKAFTAATPSLGASSTATAAAFSSSSIIPSALFLSSSAALTSSSSSSLIPTSSPSTSLFPTRRFFADAAVAGDEVDDDDGTPLTQAERIKQHYTPFEFGHHVPCGDKLLINKNTPRWPKGHWWRPTTDEEKEWYWPTQYAGDRRHFKSDRGPITPRGKFPAFFHTREKTLRKYGWDAHKTHTVKRIPVMEYIRLHDEDLRMQLKVTGDDVEPVNQPGFTPISIGARGNKIDNLTNEVRRYKGDGADLPLCFRPLLFAGRWRQARFSKRKIAMLRREVRMSGEEWPWEWMTVHQRVRPKRLKGHKKNRVKFARWRQIEENLKTMDDKIHEHKKKLRESRLNKNNMLTYLQKSTN